MKRFLSLVLSLCLLAPLSARPKVAVVLGGGGARGFAEISLLGMMEREGIPVDMVLGTSMGALVGAMYCAGYTPNEIAEFAQSNDFMSIVLEPAQQRPFPTPEAFAKRMDNSLSLGFDGLRLGSTPGLLGDSRLLALLGRMYGEAAGIQDFDELPVPFRAVATNAVTGERIVFDHGSLVDAVRSSISLPVVFAPYPQPDGSVAMDGGLVDNLPIGLAKELGADYVVAMDVNCRQRLEAKDMQSVTDSALQVATLITTTNSIRQHPEADIVVMPQVEHIGTLAFNDAEEIMRLGWEACEGQKAEFDALAGKVGKEAIDPKRTGKHADFQSRVIRDVVIRDRSTGSRKAEIDPKDFDSYVGQLLDARTKKKLTAYLERVKISSALASANWDQRWNDDGSTTLVINCSAYEQRQNRFTVGLYPDLGVSNNGHDSWTWLALEARSEFDIQGRFSLWAAYKDTVDLGASVTLPLVFAGAHRFGFEIGGSWKNGSIATESNKSYSDRIAAQDMAVLGDVNLFYNVGNVLDLRLGGQYEWVDLDDGRDTYQYARSYSSLVVDTMHELSLIQSGFRADVRYELEWRDFDSFGTALEGRFRQDISIARESVGLGYQLDFHWKRLDGKLNRSYLDIGGIDGIPGLSYGTLRQDLAGGVFRVRTRLATVLGQPVTLLCKVGAWAVGDRDPFEQKREKGWMFSGDPDWELGVGLGVAYGTPIGSLFLGAGIAPVHRNWDLMVGFVR